MGQRKQVQKFQKTAVEEIEQAAFLAVKHLQNNYFNMFTLIKSDKQVDLEEKNSTIQLMSKLQDEVSSNKDFILAYREQNYDPGQFMDHEIRMDVINKGI